jgi:hypothetical protein
MSQRKPKAPAEQPPAKPDKAEPPSWTEEQKAEARRKFGTLYDQADPFEARRVLLEQAADFYLRSMTRRRQTRDGRGYDDPDSNGGARALEMMARWCGIDRAPGDPREIVKVAAELRELLDRVKGKVKPNA